MPVLRDDVLAHLVTDKEGVYVDATFGRGGHAQALLGELGRAARLYALDRDPEAVRFGRERFADDSRFAIAHAAFSELGGIAAEKGIAGEVTGLLFDLGVSSPQLDTPGRGFSFSQDGPLDMRMDTSRGETAADWIARVSERELSDTLKNLGEERFHRRIARSIVEARNDKPIETTAALVAIVETATPRRDPHKHVATRTFQAIRIAINHELEEIAAALNAALEILAAGGRLVVISFHSLEDRIVKRFMRGHSRPHKAWAGLPNIPAEAQPKLKIIAKALRASESEIATNPRSRSAVLRVAERLA